MKVRGTQVCIGKTGLFAVSGCGVTSPRTNMAHGSGGRMVGSGNILDCPLRQAVAFNTGVAFWRARGAVGGRGSVFVYDLYVN